MSVVIDFSGKVAMVTGAARGIGAAAARAFAEAGATLVVTDMIPDVVNLAEEIAASGGKAIAVIEDISQPESAQKVVDKAMEEYGRLDFAFNNAGIGADMALLADQTDECWGRVIAVNQSAVFYCLRSQIPAMIKNGGGVIVNNSSVCGVRAITGSGPYGASKHAIIGLTRQVALEYGGQGIRAVAIGPGFVYTDMTKEFFDSNPDAAEQIIARTPMGRAAQPEDIGKAVRMLCTDDAVYVNGVYLQVDGGFLQS